ncbi:MAG: VCBS repeat-containing protein, partial [Anaerolineaceae bacterium]
GWISPKSDDCATSVAWGDWDNDGYLDLAVGGSIHIRVYDNDNGVLQLNPSAGYGWESEIIVGVFSLAWGDWDNDGDLDLATSGVGRPVRIFENDNNSLNFDPANGYGWGTQTSLSSYNVAWGDYNADGNLDLAIGNFNYHAQVYRNSGNGMTLAWESGAIMPTRSVAWGDWDGDGDLDLAAGNPGEASRVFENVDGELMFDPEKGLGQYFADGADTYSIAWGDADNDGDLDLAYGVNGNNNGVLVNQLRGATTLPNNPPTISVRPPGVTANFYTSARIWQLGDAVIPFRLADPEGDPVRYVKAYYSIDGGGTWSDADPVSGILPTNLAAPSSGADYTFDWDPVASGLMGQADNVVIKLEAYPDHRAQNGKLADINQWPFSTATSMPFRVRGNQIRVVDGINPVQGAVVYRLTPGEEPGQAFSDSKGKAYTTDSSGYLQGRGILRDNDELAALAPVSSTSSYTLYATNATPTADGLQGTVTSAQGIQILDVSTGFPLLLFNLSVSLEWDASYDTAFLDQLAYNLERVSGNLYDFTNGQIALGRVTVYQNRDNWDTADIHIMASNRLRPWGVIGGIVDTSTPAPFDPDLVYEPGMVTIGSVWNRYGNPGQIIGDDWPLILAHELSHYLLYLDDVYLGLDTSGHLVTINGCTGSAMGDLYSDPANTEFIFDDTIWTSYCTETLANHTNGRDEWAVITAWYDQLLEPSAINSGPASMTYQFTHIDIQDPATPTSALIDPTFYIIYANGRQASTSARAYLEKSDGRQISLGAPVGGQNRVLALGAEYGDRLCVFDPAYYEFGCETITVGDYRLDLHEDTSWNPIVSLMPVSILVPAPRVDTMEVTIELTTSPDPDDVYVRLFPEIGLPYDAELMTSSDGTIYTGTITLSEPSSAGLLQIYVDETSAPRRETILPYSVGGNPGLHEGATGSGWKRSGNAPLLSPDGSLIYFTGADVDFPEGTLFTVQTMSGLPALPPGRNLIGQAYRIVASPGAILPDGSVSIQYLQNDLTVAGVIDSDLAMYFYDGGGWQELATTVDDYYNMTSAPSEGSGVYALFASIRIPLLGSVWNNFPYPLRDPQTTGGALASIAGKYSLVYEYKSMTDSWLVFDPYLASGFDWVNTLTQLQFGKAYWIYATEGTTVYFGSPPTISSSAGWLPITFYGWINPYKGSIPVAGMTVSVWQDGTLKGQGITQAQGGKIVYVLQALVDDSSGPVTIQITDPWIRSVGDWYSTSTNRIDLPFADDRKATFLPLVIK